MTSSPPPFAKVLIANRGEIACRIIRTCRRLGVRTVAVFSDADEGSLHTLMADDAVLIGGARAAESYLNIAAIIDAARKTGCEAIHPGYGFLSENANFAEACDAAGICFIGPSAATIRSMSYKGAARQIAESCGVPLLPGYDGDEQDEAFLATEAERIGWPIIIKAVAGGGGKGMRRVDAPAQFPRNLAAARREAQSAFGNDQVLLEKFLVEPRHIEVQILADSHGKVVSLFERDCSIQRKHQKVIEESPAPGMPEDMRAEMISAAVRLASQVGYEGVGTVEFVADVSAGLRVDRFYFLEMNTRLQVEHPVTEMITGLDLVEWQLRVAAGEAIPFDREGITRTGHALEVRLCAEDPSKMFLPSPGELTRFDLGSEVCGLRIETGLRQGDKVTPYYDSLLAKLVVHAASRDEAIRTLGDRLQIIQVEGLKSNRLLLQRICDHPDFTAGGVSTTFIERNAEVLLAPEASAPAAT